MTSSSIFCHSCNCWGCKCGSGSLTAGEAAQIAAAESATPKRQRKESRERVPGVVAKMVPHFAQRRGRTGGTY